MQTVKHGLMAATLVSLATFFTAVVLAADFTKEQATEMALKVHPGQVTDVDEETHEGQKVWEVEIKGDDGKEWEVYYTMDGKLIKEESD